MPSFKMTLPSGRKIAVEAQDRTEALNKAMSFLSNGGMSEGDLPEGPKSLPVGNLPVNNFEQFRQAAPEVAAQSDALAESAPLLGLVAPVATKGALLARVGVNALVGGGLSKLTADDDQSLLELGVDTALSAAVPEAFRLFGAGGRVAKEAVNTGERVEKAVHNAVSEGAVKLPDVQQAMAEAQEAGIGITLDELVGAPTLGEYRKALSTASGKSGSKFLAYVQDRAAKTVSNIENLISQIGDPKTSGTALGNKVIADTESALKGLRAARNKNWEDGLNELKSYTGKLKIIQPESTINYLDNVVDKISTGSIDVKESLLPQLRKIRESMKDGLDVDQLQAKLQDFRANGKVHNENAPVWNNLLARLQADTDTAANSGTNIAARGLKVAREQYRVASETISGLENSVVGQAVKRFKGPEGPAGKNLISRIQGMDEDQLRAVIPILDKYSPNASGSIRAKTLLDALDAAKGGDADIVGNLDYAKFIEALPEGGKFRALFGETAGKTKLLSTVNTMRRLAKSQTPIRLEGGTAVQDPAAGIWGTVMSGLRALQAPALARMLMEPKKTDKLLKELTQASKGVRVFTLSRPTTTFLNELSGDMNQQPQEL